MRRRWVGLEQRSALAGAWEWLGGGPRPDGLANHAGRADLRGLPLPTAHVGKAFSLGSMTMNYLSGMAEFRGIHWRAVDFTDSDLTHVRFTASRLEDCLFDGADCTDWRLWSSQVSQCSFRRAVLRDSALGTWHAGEGNTWTDVVFDAADLRDSRFWGGAVRRCSFVDAKLKGVEFAQVDLADARFAGEVRDVLFDGRLIPDRPPPHTLTNVDFSGALLADVDFRGCKFDGVTLPSGSQRVRHFPVVARRALALVV